MRYGSVCSGIEAATQAWHLLGWTPSFFSEVDPFPRAVLEHHYPDVPLHGDFTTIEDGQYDPIDLLVGGTPCQSFSIAGLRGGLGDDRGNLALEFLRLADRLRPRWLVWENVPGVLSSLSHDAPDARAPAIDLDGEDGPKDGEEVVVTDEYETDENHALWCFMAGASELGYDGGFRVIDAQYTRTCNLPFAVPQRRRRVLFVGYLGDWRRSAAVLFDRESLSRNSPPRREAGQTVAPTISARPTGGGGLGTDFDLDGGLVADVAGALNTANGKTRPGDTLQCASTGYMVVSVSEEGNAHALRGEGFDASEDGASYTLEARTSAQAVAFDTTQITSRANYSNPKPGDPCHPLATGAHPPAVAFDLRGREGGAMPEGPHQTASIRAASGGSSRSYVATNWAVRRLTPVECERLQGFPDGFTNVPWRGKGHSPDGRRYKALGNSMAVNCMTWLGERIQLVEGIKNGEIG